MVEAEGDQGEGEIGRENGVKGRKEGSWKRSKKWGGGRGGEGEGERLTLPNNHASNSSFIKTKSLKSTKSPTANKWQMINRLNKFLLNAGIWELEVGFISLLEAIFKHAA